MLIESHLKKAFQAAQGRERPYGSGSSSASQMGKRKRRSFPEVYRRGAKQAVD